MIGASPRIVQFTGSGDAVSVAELAALADRDIVADVEARHGQAMFGFVRRLGVGDDQAQDCVQEGFARLWAELERGAEIADPKAWMYRTIYRLAMDEHRLRRRLASLVALFSQRSSTGTDPGDATDRIAVMA